MKQDMPFISVIIVNWNTKHELDECLKSLKEQDYENMEIIVMDNASRDGSVEMLRSDYPEVRVLANRKNKGFCRANNQGIQAADGKYLLLLNPDTVLQNDAIREMLKVFHEGHPDVIGVFPKLLFHDEPLFINALGVKWHIRAHWLDQRVGMLDLGRFNNSEHVFGSIFAALLADAEKFKEIGLFDPVFFTYCEDFDVSYRAGLFGYKFYTAPRAVVYHKYRTTQRTKRSRARHSAFYARNYLAVFVKNYELKNLVKFGPHILYRYIGAPILRAKRSGHWKAIWPLVRAFIGFMIRMPYYIKKRIPIQMHRRVPDTHLWNKEQVEEMNIFNYNDGLTLSLLNLRASKRGDCRYMVGNSEYRVL